MGGTKTIPFKKKLNLKKKKILEIRKSRNECRDLQLLLERGNQCGLRVRQYGRLRGEMQMQLKHLDSVIFSNNGKKRNIFVNKEK